MGRRSTRLLLLLCVLIIGALGPAASFAVQASPPPPVIYPSTALNASPGLASAHGRLAVMIQLPEPAVASAAVSISHAALQAQIAASQSALLPYLPALDAHVLFQTNLAYNGVAVSIPADRVEQLRRLPGIAKVSVIAPKLPAGVAVATAQVTPIVQAVAAATGRGVRIGVIDRGIDYTHADFGGAGTPAAYAANNPAIIEPGSFPTAKVNGYDFAGDAYDASGANVIPTPDPDPLECNSTDAHNGQGTSVAALAAGQGVAADGAPYRGPYGPRVNISALKVAPGIAPEAQLFALKVFGCQGSTALLTQAIDRAIDPDGNGDPTDHLDVLVISLGTPFGSADDPDAIAVDNAVRAGITVVVAAGDTSNTFYSLGSPASASLAIAVGATNPAGGVADFSARGPVQGNRLLKPDLVAPGVNIRAAALGSGSAAAAHTGTAIAAAQVAGAAALLRQLHAGWSPMQLKVALMNTATPVQLPVVAPPSLAGAGQLDLSRIATVALLAYSSDTADVGLNYGAPWVASSWTATRTLQLENTSATARAVTLAAIQTTSAPGVSISVPEAPIIVPANGSTQATVHMTIDPQKLDFTPDPATQLEQNSYARHYLAEHAGSIELTSMDDVINTRVRPAHAAHFQSVDMYLDDRLLDDSLDSREVQKYVSVKPGPHIVSIRKPGAARSSTPLFSAPVNLLNGRDYTLALIGRPGALGILPIDETAPAPALSGQALIHFTNANQSDPLWDIGALDVYVDGVMRIPALAISASSAYIAIDPGQHTIEFFHADADPAKKQRVTHKTITVDAGQIVLVGSGRHNDDDGTILDDEQRTFIGYGDTRYLGEIRSSDDGYGTPLIERVPFQVFPSAAADARAAGPLQTPAGMRSFALGLHNTGARNEALTGSLPSAQTPLASAFELEASSPPIVGVSQNTSAADIQYLGVTSNYSVTQNLTNSALVYFGLSTYGAWSTPNEAEFQIYIDANSDGRDDFVLTNTNWGAVTNQAPSDVFISALYPLDSAGTVGMAGIYSYLESFPAPIQSGVNLAPFNTAVLFQLVSTQNLRLPLDPNNPAGLKGPAPISFCYHVETRARNFGNFGQVVDRVPETTAPALAACGNRSGVLRYDLQNAGIAPINTTNFVFGAPTTARPIFVDTEGGQITGAVNPALLAGSPGHKLLILHHHNAPGAQAELVDIVAPVQASSFLGAGRVYVPISRR